MSQFYGTVEGQAKTTATRRGSASSGITTYAAGWSGASRVDGFEGEDGEDRYLVYLVPGGSSGGTHRMLAEGRLEARA